MKKSLALGRFAGIWALGMLFSLAAGAQVLEIAAIYQNTFGGVNGIRGNRSVIVSDDGLFAYATGESDASVVVFSRNPANGFLTQIQRLRNGFDGIDGLRGANTVRLSPENDTLYASGFFGDALAVFSRDAVTGLLTEIQVIKDNTPAAPDGLDGVLWIQVSNNGRNVYTTAFFDKAVVVWDRDKDTGLLTFRQILKDGVGGINGLNGAYPLFMDHSNKNVYVGGVLDNTLSVFKRKSSDGTLTLIQELKDGVDGLDGLGEVRGLVGDKEGKFIYAVASTDNSISTFKRDKSDGKLTEVQVIKDSDPGIDGLAGTTGINITPDGRYVIATGFTERKMSVWARDVHGDDDDDHHEGDSLQADDDEDGTGQLSLAQVLVNLVDTPFGLNGPLDLNTSPDGCYVYSSSYNVHIILQWHVIGCVPGTDDDEEDD